MKLSGASTVLVRPAGELGVKSASVQRRMERTLQENVESMLETGGFDASVETEHTRVYVHTRSPEIEEITRTLTRVFGVSSVSPVVTCEPTVDAICEVLAETAREHYSGESFAVRARRAGQREAHPFSSPELERAGGTAVFEAAQEQGIEPTVDLDDPETTFGVECRPERAFVYLERYDGPGGMPVGTQQPVVALVSGGIDSPVAAWLAMKRGCPVYPLYVDLGAFGGVDHRARAEQTVATLTRFTPGNLTLRVAPGGVGFERITDSTEMYRMLLARRFMLRIAAHLADRIDAVGVVTGESIGQKSSQTAAALRVTGAVTDYPVHRPLLSLDKEEIIEQAKTIGTYEDATIDAGCNRLAPDNPATRPSLDVVRDAEPEEIDDYAREAVRNVETVSLSETDESCLSLSGRDSRV